MKPTRVIQINIDLRIFLAVILALSLLLITTLTIKASSPSVNSAQVNTGSPNDVTPTAPVEQPETDAVPLSSSPNGAPTVQEPAADPQNSGGNRLTASGSSPNAQVYLTNFDRLGNNVLTACSTGYHMASMWEIADISNFTYNTNHPDAYSKADSGQGPPANWYGWVRTGYNSSTVNVAGQGNCANWTGTTGYGTIVRLVNNWDVVPGALSSWETDTWGCSGTAPIWCVGDFSTVYLPVITK